MKYSLLVLVIASFLAAACISPVQPVQPPDSGIAPAVPTAALEEVKATSAGGVVAQDVLGTNPWQWVSFTSPVEQFDVETPLGYLLAFDADGTVNIVADCNRAMGSYTEEAGALTIVVGPMTMAACPPESRSDEFVKYLGSAARYFFDDGRLLIDLMADGGTMAFDSADPSIMAEDGEGAVADADSGAAPIPVEALKNATYSGVYDEPITLTDGLYEGQPFVEGDASRPVVQYIDGTELYGDLDGDGVDDAVVFLLESSGGSGTFTYVAVQLNQGGEPTDAGAVMIEDRIGVKSAAIEDGQIVLEIITQGPGDVACCSTHKARRTYALQEGRLKETTPEGGDLVRLSTADLVGATWTLVELSEGEPAVADSGVTISFQDDELDGFGGCNDYTAGFTLGEENPLVMTIGPVLATQKSCPDPIGSQESAYFAALQKVSRWGYVYGKLALYYADGENGESRLLFAPQIGPDADAPVSVPPPTEDLTMLRANPWQWVSFTNPVEAFDIEDPASYRLSFNTDATLGITADCNDVVGFYQGEYGESLTIETGPATLAECGTGSRSDQFVKLLAGGARYFFEDGNLHIDLLADGGTMVFAPADTEAVAEPDDYVAASSITRNGFAVDGKAMRALDGQEMKIWGFVDHGNLYGDESAKAILEDWWSGEGPTATTWRFNLKASADDAVGHSFEVRVPNDQGRDDLLRAFVAAARAQRPTKVFVKGKMFTFDAPTGGALRTGLQMELASSGDILLALPDDKQ